MRPNSFAYLLLLSSLIFLFCSSSWAVDTGPIDRVRQKDVLSEDDFDVIEQFVYGAIDKLVNTEDFTQVARLRSIIITRQSEQAQYADRYSRFLREYITEVMVEADDIADAARRHRLQSNLMILVAELQDPRLVDIAMEQLDSDDKVVQYWAARALTSPALIEKIENAPNSSLVINKIATEFENQADNASEQTLRVMVGFSAAASSERAERFLLKIADSRIQAYADWTAQTGPVDTQILKLLCEKLRADRGDKAELGRRFAQLYSYVMQKYIMTLQNPDLLNEQQKEELVSVLVEIEDKCIGRLTGLQQSVIRRTIELGDANGLIMEHSRLLGGSENRGELPAKFSFDYGRADDGSVSMQPRELPEPPDENNS